MYITLDYMSEDSSQDPRISEVYFGSHQPGLDRIKARSGTWLMAYEDPDHALLYATSLIKYIDISVIDNKLSYLIKEKFMNAFRLAYESETVKRPGSVYKLDPKPFVWHKKGFMASHKPVRVISEHTIEDISQMIQKLRNSQKIKVEHSDIKITDYFETRRMPSKKILEDIAKYHPNHLMAYFRD